jgi:hypothetical protein
MLVEPARPGFHQTFSLIAGVLMQMEHATGTAPAGTAFCVAIEHLLAFQEVDGLMQNRF